MFADAESELCMMRCLGGGSRSDGHLNSDLISRLQMISTSEKPRDLAGFLFIYLFLTFSIYLV